MKQTNAEQLKKGQDVLEEFRQLRGGTVLEFHKRMSNDPALMRAFTDQYLNCNKTDTQIPRKYRELVMMALGCAQGTATTIRTHGRLAIEHGATVEEVGEVLRLVFFMCGATAIIPAMELFDIPEE
ncbi:MAG: carboxymuconolactone decarboxylase family protein [Oscillospiraceae bacterium]|nr:carboxymuconolactone decarboxylase family protein [Oscillospiraceae bacterium]MBQ4538110.1 carboxymuconolactone decarboxylase family protein [Oscillospiraceae bacterium]